MLWRNDGSCRCLLHSAAGGLKVCVTECCASSTGVKQDTTTVDADESHTQPPLQPLSFPLPHPSVIHTRITHNSIPHK